MLWLSLLQNVLFQRVYKARMAAWNFLFFFFKAILTFCQKNPLVSQRCWMSTSLTIKRPTLSVGRYNCKLSRNGRPFHIPLCFFFLLPIEEIWWDGCLLKLTLRSVVLWLSSYECDMPAQWCWLDSKNVHCIHWKLNIHGIFNEYMRVWIFWLLIAAKQHKTKIDLWNFLENM